jgi:starvation-inducible outer membrane lipoprotein
MQVYVHYKDGKIGHLIHDREYKFMEMNTQHDVEDFYPVNCSVEMDMGMWMKGFRGGYHLIPSLNMDGDTPIFNLEVPESLLPKTVGPDRHRPVRE